MEENEKCRAIRSMPARFILIPSSSLISASRQQQGNAAPRQTLTAVTHVFSIVFRGILSLTLSGKNVRFRMHSLPSAKHRI